MSEYSLFTSESVSEGHPDKIADQISDAVLDAIIAQDKHARVAVETLVKTGVAIVAGEVTTSAWVDLEQIVRDVICDIGYTSSDVGFDGATCGVLNMVLHHFAAPAEAMRQLSPLINSGGHLLITELCSHNQAWAREACGDLWLGFEQDDLARWAEAAGLRVGESLYLGLKNGFQIQVRHFAKP